MVFEKVIIVTPSFEQRVSKMAYSFVKRGIQTIVYAEEASVSAEFCNYVQNVKCHTIPVANKLKRTPLGINRIAFLRKELSKELSSNQKTLIISRDVNYGYIVGKVLHFLKSDNYFYITDIADNYDLFYSSFSNMFERVIFKSGFGYLTGNALKESDAVFIVAEINRQRIQSAFRSQLKNKPVFLLRNLPMHVESFYGNEKIKDSLVYVGKIDEISRDPFYVLEKLIDMPGYTLHLYSEQKRATIEKMKEYAKNNNIQDRVIFHQRVQYDLLAREISQYQVGLVPHKRSLLTDYTTPNKIYDYKNSGIVTVMSDCPSLISENDEFHFGLVYSKEADDFIDVVEKAMSYSLDYDNPIPEWDEEFEAFFSELSMIE